MWVQGGKSLFVSVFFTNFGTFLYSPFFVIISYKASNMDHHKINRICLSDNHHWQEGSTTGVENRRMLWVMELKTGKFPQFHLIYGLIFPENLYYTGANIFKHNFIMFPWLIYHFVHPTIFLMYSHCDKLFDALLSLVVFENYIFFHLE